VGVIPDAGPGYIFNPDGSSCYGKDQDDRDIALQTDAPSGDGRYDTPSFPGLGHPAFGNFGEGVSFLAPTIGLKRALDLQLDEYQPGQDFLGVWNASSGQFRPGFPAPVNDLQFLTGPSVADIDGNPGEEALEGTASMDLAAFNAAGTPASTAWPKLTGDWMVANPLIGSFGTIDTEAASKKKVVAITRSGYVLAYNTAAPACSAGSWPRFHHDNANSGDYERDATSPGVPFDGALAGGALTWKAPGDDLLCGTAAKYEMRHSAAPITPGNFATADELPAPPAPAAAGTAQSYTLPGEVKRYVAVRARDDQGNDGRPLVLDTQAPAQPGEGPPPAAGPQPGAPGGGPGAGTPGAGGTKGATGKSRCVSRRAAVTSEAIGKVNVGTPYTDVLGALGQPLRAKTGVFRYCVTGGGRFLVAFDRLGRVRLIASTAPRHAAKGVRTGSSLAQLKRRFPKARLITRRVLAAGPLFGVRGSKVRWVGAADRSVARSKRRLGLYLRALKLG
jgi:hypothetical protein